MKHSEAEAWEGFLDMCVGQCGIWVGENIEPECLCLVDEACRIYATCPSARRFYPVGLLPLRRTGVNQDEHQLQQELEFT